METCANCPAAADYVVDHPSANILFFCAACVPSTYVGNGMAQRFDVVPADDNPDTPEDESLTQTKIKKK